MQVTCPECGTAFTPEEDGAQVTCPACFAAVALDAPDRWMELELRAPGGRALGTFDRYAVREQIYLGAFKGQEQVRPASGGEWVDIVSRPEFAEILALMGVDLGAGQIAKQSLKGWRKTGSAIQTRKRAATSQSVIGQAQTAASGEAKVKDVVEERETRTRIVVAVVLGVLGLLGAWVAFG
ncbi:MAG: hypothetical protein H6741_09935 [Alphaproteobacteria bacterium]|nr:hypothetical protein [Alphaproteobacteria bacterium]MCB9793032.1 hypothetical protein [Alphaproteobacteria bacterium]